MRKVEIERFSLISSKPFEVVMEALKAVVGQPDLLALFRAFDRARSFVELENAVQKGLGRTGLMLFMEFDLGSILRKENGLSTPKIVRFLIGNPLIVRWHYRLLPAAAG